MKKGKANWKKYLKYFFGIWLMLNVILYFLASRNLTRMYGGLTERVDHTQFNTEAFPVIIKNVNVLSPDCKTFLERQNVSIKNGVISSIDSIFQNPDNIKVIDGENKFLIPGLTDAHIHLWKSPNDLLLFVANGVTQIRELIGEEDHLQWRDEIKNGRIGPEMFVASPRLGSFGTFEGWWMEWSQGFENITDAADAEKSVQYFYDKGYDGIKIYSQLNKESYDAICSKAESLGMKVMGHVPFSTSLEDIYNSSQEEVAHFEEIMNALNREFGNYNWENTDEFFMFLEKRSLEVANELIGHDIIVTTTLFGTENTVANKFDLENQLRKVEFQYVNPGLAEWSSLAPGGLGWLPKVSRHKVPDDLTEEEIAGRRLHWETYEKAEHIVAKNLIKKGVKLMTGTDAGLPIKVAGFSLHDEFISLNNAGMSPAEILRSATVIPSEWMETNAGIIASGKRADLLLLDKNPLTDIANTKSINSVIINGKILDRNKLNEMLEAVKTANANSRTEDISQYVGGSK